MAEATGTVGTGTGAPAGEQSRAGVPQQGQQGQQGQGQVKSQGGMPTNASISSNGTVVDNNTGEQLNGEEQILDFDSFDPLADLDVTKPPADLSEYDFPALRSYYEENGIKPTPEMAKVLNQYRQDAKLLGVSPEHFKFFANVITQNEMGRELENINKTMKSDNELFKSVNEKMSIEEKQAWKPIVKGIQEKFGEETAKKIGLDYGLFKAFYDIKTGSSTTPKEPTQEIQTNNIQKLKDSRIAELRANLGDQEAIKKINEKYNKINPEVFKLVD